MKVLIAEDHGIVRQGLKALIEEEPDMQVVGEAEDGQTAVQLAEELSPDVILMDITMPDLDGIEAARRILGKNPNARIVALSMHSDRRFVSEMLKAGASGYVLKSYLFGEVVRALHVVAAGEHYLSPKITDVLVEDFANRRSASKEGSMGKLTERECQIVQLLTEGQTVKQIALRLNISPKTADANRRHIMDKLGISSLAELTKYAIREGLTSLDV